MAEKLNAEKQVIKCKHCNNEISQYFLSDFCCLGCKQVYEILQVSGLGQYYDYREFDAKKSYDAVRVVDRTFDYFNEDDFIKQNVIRKSDQQSFISFYLTGVQCPACVWLIEKLPKFCNGVIGAELNFKNSVVNITYNHKHTNLSEIALKLTSLGYLPKPYHPSQEEEIRKKSTNLLLIQLGVAGFCAGNTMLLAVSLYQGFFSGIEHEFLGFIHIISFLLTLPVISFSAQPFFKAAFASLKLFRLHIDVPISIGIISAFLFSTYNLFFNPEHVYFDSICMLVFLLLTGRFLQKIALEKAFKNNDIEDYLLPKFARVKNKNNLFVEIELKKVKKNEVVRVYKNEVIPIDGKVISGDSGVDNSFLTGESKPIAISANSYVYAGAKNLNSTIDIEVEKDFYSSRIYKLISMVKNTGKVSDSASEGLNKFTNFFVLTVFFLVLLCFLYWLNIGDLQAGIINSISILIITCPCALGLARPLVIAKAVTNLSKKGVIIKKNYVFEMLPKVKNFYFDKTGTITNGLFEIKEKFISDNIKEDILINNINLLEKNSNHPIKNAFLKYQKNIISKISLEQFKVIEGRGINGIFSDKTELYVGSKKYFLSFEIIVSNDLQRLIDSLIELEETTVFAFNKKELLGIFILSDQERLNIDKFFKFLNIYPRKLFILSGDARKVVQRIAENLDFEFKNVFFELLPEDKAEIIKKDSELNCMIGDGANDAPALRSADLSIGVGGSSEVNLLVADCFISRPSTENFFILFRSIKTTNSIIQRNILISIIYNLVGSYFAFFGYINPLVAAILMPLSSFTVILSSLMYKTKAYQKF